MKSALSSLFESENAGDVIAFLRDRGQQAHVIAPSWVRDRVFGPTSDSSGRHAATWSHDAGAESTVPAGKVNFVVLAEDAEQERAIVLSLAQKKGRSVYGLFGHVVPALLCSAKGMAAGRPTDNLKRYAFLCVPRSGSRYLSAVLSNRGVGVPREHIREPLANIIARGKLDFRRAIGALERFGQRNEIFGTKLISTFLIRASHSRMSELKDNIEWMSERGYRLIRLDRPLNETVISSYIAFQMRQWHFFGEMNDQLRAKLDSLVFEDGAAWDEFLRFRSEKIIVDSIADALKMPSFQYAEIEADIDNVVGRLCQYIDVKPETLRPGSAPIPFASRTVSPTYASFEAQLADLLDRRAGEVEAYTVKKTRALTGLDKEAAEKLVAGRA
jgi:hypothetical protein